jgi:hypothetical protein
MGLYSIYKTVDSIGSLYLTYRAKSDTINYEQYNKVSFISPIK